MNNLNLNSIILIGPLATGKSTLGIRLSERLGVPNYPIDRLKWYYRFKNGYCLSVSQKILSESGFEVFLNHCQRYFSPSDLADVLDKFQGIIDLGATDSYADHDLTRFHELEEVLGKHKNVFLILPDESIEKSELILTNRLIERYKYDPIKNKVIDSYISMNSKFISSFSNYSLANHIIYTKDRNIDDICDEIANLASQNEFNQISKKPNLKAC